MSRRIMFCCSLGSVSESLEGLRRKLEVLEKSTAVKRVKQKSWKKQKLDVVLFEVQWNGIISLNIRPAQLRKPAQYRSV